METCFDHVYGEKTFIVYTGERKWLDLIRKLKEDYPDSVEVLNEYKDGFIRVRLPYEWMKIKPKKRMELSEEKLAALKENLELARLKKNGMVAAAVEGEDYECHM